MMFAVSAYENLEDENTLYGFDYNAIAVSFPADAFDGDVKAVLESGMNARLAKPIDMVELKQLISKLVPKKDE